MTETLERDLKQETRELIAEIKAMGWSSIKLTRRTYRGGINTYKTSSRTIVPVFFYLDEAFVVEDENGLFGVQDLKHSLQDTEKVDIFSSGRIEGLKLVSYVDERGVNYVEENLDQLDINTKGIREDIAKRLKLVSKLGSEVEVEL